MLRQVSKRFANVCASAPRTQAATPRNFSTLLNEKERADENRFFRREEERQRQVLRAQFEKMIESKETLSQIKQILEPPKIEKKSLMESLHLYDWRVSLPLGFLLSSTIIRNELIPIDPEFAVANSFLLFLGILSVNLGPHFSGALNDYSSNVQKTFESFDNVDLSSILASVDDKQELLSIKNETSDFFELSDAVHVVEADNLNYAAEHEFRDAIQKKLDAIAVLNDNVHLTIRSKMISSIQQDVLTQLNSDKKIKEAALDQAIAVLMAGTGAKLGKDVVGSVFQTAIKTCRDEFEKKSPEIAKVMQSLSKDADALASAPQLSGVGGNIYDLAPRSAAH